MFIEGPRQHDAPFFQCSFKYTGFSGSYCDWITDDQQRDTTEGGQTHAPPVETSIQTSAEFIEILQHGVALHDRAPVPQHLLRTTLPPKVDNCRSADIVIPEAGTDDLIVQIHVFRIHKIVLGKPTDARENVRSN